MIRFTCPGCGKSYSIGDEAAGRTALCKACGCTIVVPSNRPSTNKIVIGFDNSQTGKTGSAQTKLPPRTRRLMADAEQMRRAFEGFPLIRVLSMTGQPPERYHIEYLVKGLARGSSAEPVVRNQHTVEIILTSDYPLQSPKCKMLTQYCSARHLRRDWVKCIRCVLSRRFVTQLPVVACRVNANLLSPRRTSRA
jgi:hypothetical protein